MNVEFGPPIALVIFVMIDLENFVDLHESLVLLLQNMPRRSFVGLLARVIDLHLPANYSVVERTPVVEVPSLGKPRKRRIADLVLVVKASGQVCVTFVIEVQETWKLAKGHDWMIFAVAFASRYDRKAQVMVVAPKPRLRKRIRELIAKIDEPVYTIELDHFEQIDDDNIARFRPYETILGALYRANQETLDEDVRVAGIRAALIALESLDRLNRVDASETLGYFGLIMSTAPPEIGERALDAAIESGDFDAQRLLANWEYWRGGTLHEWSKREGREEGRGEGRVEGRAEALRLVIMELLAHRPTDNVDLRRRVESCDDPATLERWFRALAASEPNAPIAGIFA